MVEGSKRTQRRVEVGKRGRQVPCLLQRRWRWEAHHPMIIAWSPQRSSTEKWPGKLGKWPESSPCRNPWQKSSSSTTGECRERNYRIKGVNERLCGCWNARTAVRLRRWSRDKLFERFMEDSAECLEKSGVRDWRIRVGEARSSILSSIRAPQQVSSYDAEGAASDPFLCDVCFTDFEASSGYHLGCGHVFCRECWEGELSTAVTERGAQALGTRCLMQGCTARVTRRTVEAVASAETQEKWRYLATQHFVSANRAMAWCPAPRCGNAFLAFGPVRQVTCTCGMKFWCVSYARKGGGEEFLA